MWVRACVAAETNHIGLMVGAGREIVGDVA